MLFADDSLLFFRAKQEGYDVVVDVLRTYELCSSQLINLNKSCVYFSYNTSHYARVRSMDIFGIDNLITNDPYLGLPLMFDRSRGQDL